MLELKYRINKLIDKGFTYDKETNTIYTHKNKIIKGRQLTTIIGDKTISVSKAQFIYYMTTGVFATKMHYKDGDSSNIDVSNLELYTHQLKEYNKKHKPEITIPKISKPRKPYDIKTSKHYLNSIELTYEMVVSNGKGKLTDNSCVMLSKMVDGVAKKFSYRSTDDAYDVKQEALLSVLVDWRGYDYDKYPNAFPYFTEIIKRALARGYNKLRGKKGDIIPSIMSMNDFTGNIY